MSSGRTIAGIVAGAWGARKALGWYRRSQYDLTGRVALVSGGSRGLGLNLCRRLAEEGARIALLARDEAELDRAVSDLAGYGMEVAAFPCDITDERQATSTVGRVIERFGRLDVLINNAGVIQVGPLDHMSLEDFETSMAVHFWGPLWLMRSAIPQMRRQGEGRIVNISSIGGRVAAPHLAPYTASKFALTGLSDAMRAELARDGIRVTTVIPGLMRTGSPPKAWFKGRHNEEFGWFVVFDSLPVLSTSAGRAARRIIAACRRGDARLVLTLPAKLAILAEAVAPEVFATMMSTMNRMLPAPSLLHGKEAHKGEESHSRWARSTLTALSDRAARENNEVL